MNSKILEELNKKIKETDEVLFWMKINVNMISKEEYLKKIKIIENNINIIKEKVNE